MSSQQQTSILQSQEFRSAKPDWDKALVISIMKAIIKSDDGGDEEHH